MDGDAFGAHVTDVLAPAPTPGDTVVMDNPPPYSPEFNAIEMAFSKLKAILQKAAARTIDDLTPTECRNYSAATGYRPEQIESAPA